MNAWIEDLLTLATVDHEVSEAEVFDRVQLVAKMLGFDYCAYGLRIPWPITQPTVLMLNNYPDVWQRRYAESHYLENDPTVSHGQRSTVPLIWSDVVFQANPQLWADARDIGLSVGWVQSVLDGYGGGGEGEGMLTLARSGELLTLPELEEKQLRMQWLVNVAHMALSRVFNRKLVGELYGKLTVREIEVLKWHADGKTSSEIGEILAVSENTIKMHTKHAVFKLCASNKTSAVVRAAMLGLLS